MADGIEVRGTLQADYPDILTPRALDVIAAVAPLDERRREVLAGRLRRRAERIAEGRGPGFLDADGVIPGTEILVADARAGRFRGSEIPRDLQRQWVQGTGPATRPGAPPEVGLRNVAYALLSGADGWMFDGEDALGQTGTMSLDNQRNLKLAFDRDPVFMGVAEQIAGEINGWAQDFFGRPTIADWRTQLGFTTRIFRPRGLHLDDRHIRHADGRGLCASIVDAALYVVSNHERLRADGSSIVLYLPKIQTAEEAAVWDAILGGIEQELGLEAGAVKAYVLVEQLEAAYQLMEIRAVLGRRFVGFNTGRWDYINSVSDAMAGDLAFANPNIQAVAMTYGYMRHYEDRVRRAVNTPDEAGGFALWQGGMEPNIPVGSETGVEAGMARAMAGADREQQAGASGKWVAHWKMVHIVRPVWEHQEADNQMGRDFSPLTYTAEDAANLTQLEGGPRTVAGARDLVSVAMQYGNAFMQGMQAAALKPADAFGNDDVLYLMEDMATGEIRASILWEWFHKAASFTEDDPETGIKTGDEMTPEFFGQLVAEEYEKLQRADDRDVFDSSKRTTLPISRELLDGYVRHEQKLPWLIDLLNINLDNHELAEAQRRIARFVEVFDRDGERVTENVDF
ncbi:MAG: malate synthase [Chloroflexi bacterium]|nr:malate synthase [Chloroflexota bacterium]